MKTLTVLMILLPGISSYAQPIDNDNCRKTIDCTTAVNRPEASGCNNPFFGDWQYLQDNTYYEAFFSDDTVYSYNELFGLGSAGQPYELAEKEIITYFGPGNCFKLSYEVVDHNKLRLFGKDEIIRHNDTITQVTDLIMERIQADGFRFSDVRCWGTWSTQHNCFIVSHDGAKYKEEFSKRMLNYKSKQLH